MLLHGNLASWKSSLYYKAVETHLRPVTIRNEACVSRHIRSSASDESCLGAAGRLLSQFKTFFFAIIFNLLIFLYQFCLLILETQALPDVKTSPTHIFHVVLNPILLQVRRSLSSVEPLCRVHVGLFKVVSVDLQLVIRVGA